jgi:hypothetical protein
VTHPHLHLTADELDQLLDADDGAPPGPAAAPLAARLLECMDCRARFDEELSIVQLLESLPRRAPSHGFADRVMADVTVIVPWHVVVRDTARSFAPRVRAARIAAMVTATASAGILSLAMIWLVTHTDFLVFATTVVGDRVRDVMVELGGAVVVALFGEQALDVMMKAGNLGLAAVLLGVVGASAGALLSLRAIAATAERRRG